MGLFSKPPAGDVGATGEPLVVTLAAGSQISLAVNTHASDEVEAQLLGKPKEGEVSHSVSVRMFRDTASPYPDSVKVETLAGDLVGWIVKRQSRDACRLVDAITKAIRKAEPTAANRPVVLGVTARATGDWEPDGDGWYASLDGVVVRIKEPAEVSYDLDA